MQKLNSIFLEKANTVIEVINNCDVEITLWNKKVVFEKLKQIDYNFYKEIYFKSNFSFSYGDKYFAPINEIEFICIPKKANINNIEKMFANDKQFKNWLLLDFKQMKSKLSGYFDLLQ